MLFSHQKIVLCKCSASEVELVVEVEVEAPGNSLRLRPAGKSPRTGAFSKFHPQTSPLSSRMSCFPRSPGNPSVGKSECLTASVVDLEVLNLKTPCDQSGDQAGHEGPAEASAFLPPPAGDDSSVLGVAEPVGCDQVAASGVSLFHELGPVSDPGEIVLEDMNSLSPGVWVADQIQGSLQSAVSLHDRPQASDAELGLSDAEGCNRLLPVLDPKFCCQQVLPASQNLSPAMALDEAPLLKVVRFAPEFLSATAPSCAPLRRKLSPCSDVCSSVDVVNHDLMVPPLDGLAAIDPDLTPYPISRISIKYSLAVSTSGEPFSSISNGSLDRAKKKARSRTLAGLDLRLLIWTWSPLALRLVWLCYRGVVCANLELLPDWFPIMACPSAAICRFCLPLGHLLVWIASDAECRLQFAFIRLSWFAD
ncbi:hypothetical protein Nepgr_023136 [Nepenthes gracilis]|uniref:Uncharacterized protein n=1 Tax=Nepenthes gracilis TaxID=150966 RepID=A0AAD3T289_NEPGR|nr:hypothetical protein Nepgr_023136 [Nepenthes gracilis]